MYRCWLCVPGNEESTDVLSGSGTKKYGGRFAGVGTRAVYLSVTGSGASKEVTARKARLGSAAQISTDKYPRVVYAVFVDLKRVLDLSSLGASQPGKEVIRACLTENDLSPSMDLARELEAEGIQGLVFPSLTCRFLEGVIPEDGVLSRFSTSRIRVERKFTGMETFQAAGDPSTATKAAS